MSCVPLNALCRVCSLEILRIPYKKFLLELCSNGDAGVTGGSDRDHPFRPPEPLVSRKANRRPARSLFHLPPPPAMSDPTQYVSKKEVAASYRPKSYVSPLWPIPNVPCIQPSPRATSFDGFPPRLEMYDLTRTTANVPRFTPRTSTVQGPERHYRCDNRRVGRRGVGIFHRGRETR